MESATAMYFSQRLAFELSEPETHSCSGVDLTWVDNKGLMYAAIVFAVVCCFVSFGDLREHLSRFDYPQIQKLEMRIIMMIPIYAFFSALSLLMPRWRFFFETVRDTYESFVLYIFFMLMVSYCGGEGELLRSLKKKRYKGMHPFPMCYIPSFPLDTSFYLRCKRWVLQCALVKPVVSFIAMVCHPIGIYQEGSFTVNNVYTYTCIIVNISLTMALYYLVLFEIECEKELHYAKTFLKFLCVKSIIFFSYWQSVVVSLAALAKIVCLGSTEEAKEANSAIIQDLLMCFELLPVAFLHRAAFGRSKLDEEMAAVPVYMKDNNTGDLRSNVDTALDVNDIIDDTFGTIFFRKGKLVDQENDSDNEEDYGQAAGNADDGGGGGGAAASAGASSGTNAYNFVTNADSLARDPTLEELVRHAIATDYGVRADGILHYDADSDREERNQDMNFADTDVILRRSKYETAAQDVKVDTDLLRSHQVAQGGATPQIYCVVCGRFDREMVRRRNGYKCKECVGTKSKSLLRVRQREANEGEEMMMSPLSSQSRRGGRLGHNTSAVIVAENVSDDAGQGGSAYPTARGAPPDRFASAGPSSMMADQRQQQQQQQPLPQPQDDDDELYVQPMPAEANADLVGVARLSLESGAAARLTAPATAIAEGFANLQQVLRQTFKGDDSGGGSAGYSGAAVPPTVPLPPRASAGPPPARSPSPAAVSPPASSAPTDADANADN
ncbi:hypothetical protein ABB37_07420 [Leptomonas pyrrhocoris]|uniref:Organic solute transporter Ostalpha n=1 Tax=Leptomonas pyrrhocoris TaxID=157538 RepID=A0A0N0DT94_LEPPY|nr:hypothetical protein ABB37_07420 [Leptomonas pyrrhocoris]KPA77098.1 hypothetical protein ABB37_07420 [Leptomonas pyrrhocoris]|eukprot:XP_015655537.1 hypothetical protein ABB37_07420 [Leptomonas pyrrhocoris]